MSKVVVDKRLKLTSSLERSIIIILRQWNSKVTWDLLIQRINADLGVKVSKPTLRKFEKICTEFDKAKARYRAVGNLSPNVVKEISSNEMSYYEKYKASLVERKVLQEIVDEQYALIERIFKNVEEIPNLTVADLVQERFEDM